MNRVIHMAGIDFLKLLRKKMIWLALLPVLTVFMLTRSEPASATFGVAYCIFISMIIAVFPFQSEDEKETGFLQMLPSLPAEPVYGHFLFSFLVVAAGMMCALLSLAAADLIRPGSGYIKHFCVEGLSGGMLFFGAALILTALENMVFTVFRFKSQQVMVLIRMAPAFLLFFAANFVEEKSESLLAKGLQAVTGLHPAFTLALALIIYLLIAFMTGRIFLKKRYQS